MDEPETVKFSAAFMEAAEALAEERRRSELEMARLLYGQTWPPVVIRVAED